MKRLTIGIALFIALYIVPMFAGGDVGTAVKCVGAKCLVGASSSAPSIVTGFVSFVVLLLLPRHPFKPTHATVGFWRMAGAWTVDALLVTTGFAALFAVPMLIAELQYTGSFAWQFVREFTRPTDWTLALIAVLGSFAILAAVRVMAHVSGEPSFGQYLLGYQVIHESDSKSVRSALVRIGWATLYLVVWPVYLLYKFATKLEVDPWDRRCATKAVKFEYS